MKYRTAPIMVNTNMGLAGQFILPIRVQDPITALQFLFSVQVGAGARLTHLLEAFTRVEIVDGNDVLLSLSGGQLDGMHFYDAGKEGGSFFSNIPTATEAIYTRLLFGRWFGDEQLAFDPTKFLNPQIRITFNGALVEAAAVTCWAQINAECFDEKKITPIGFLQNREYQRFTPVTGAWAPPVQLPVDLIMRKLIVQPYFPTMGHPTILGTARLDEDNDKRVIFNLFINDLADIDEKRFGMMQVGGFLTVQGAAAPIFVSPSWGMIPKAIDVTGVAAVQAALTGGGRVAYATLTNTDLLFIEVRGSSPYHMLAYPFGDQNDIDDWYNLENVGDLRLQLLGGTAVPVGATTRVILQQLRKY